MVDAPCLVLQTHGRRHIYAMDFPLPLPVLHMTAIDGDAAQPDSGCYILIFVVA
jgi:hypothetical protein